MNSLAIQARFLSRRLERHLLGNHLFANAKALIFAGLFFEGPEADQWRNIGFRILNDQFDEQILSDGGQFERSPMYHALALEDVLDLINVARTFESSLNVAERAALTHWQEIVPSMLHWLSTLTHPDGEISFFNDAAFGGAPHRTEIEAYAQRLNLKGSEKIGSVTWLSDSGYVRLQKPDAVLLCDLAPIGPDYQPGHAHADTLSFELSLFGYRVIVNSGTSEYGISHERLRQRSTPAHSTVTVDGCNSSDVWSGFRVGLRARPFELMAFQNGDCLVAEGKHDGYRKLIGKPIHHRRWELMPGSVMIIDSVKPDTHHSEARYHLHPEVKIEQSSNTGGGLVLASGKRVLWRSDGGVARIEASMWHQEFGKSLASECLVLPLHNGSASLKLEWA